MRFTGTCETICGLDVTALIAWANAIELCDWPTVAGSMRGPEWRGAANVVEPHTKEILAHFPNAVASLHYFSMILPSHQIAPHRDEQLGNWVCRVHVPIFTNQAAWITIDAENFHLQTGAAYKVNTLKQHSVRNDGLTPRLHWMFDVLTV